MQKTIKTQFDIFKNNFLDYISKKNSNLEIRSDKVFDDLFDDFYLKLNSNLIEFDNYQIFNSALFSIVLFDSITHTVHECNSEFLKLIQLDKSQVTGKTFENIYGLKISFLEIQEQLEIFSEIEIKSHIIINLNIGIIPVISKIKNINLAGNIYTAVIDAKYVMQEEQSKNIYTEIFNNVLIKSLPDALTITDINGKIIFASEKALELFSLSDANEIIGTTPFDWLSDEYKQKAAQSAPDMLMNDFSKSSLFKLKRKNNSEFHAEISTALIKNSNEQLHGVVSIIKDVSTRIEIENKLNLVNNSLRALIDNTDDYIFSIDTNYKLTAANESFIISMQKLYNINLTVGESFDLLKYSKEQHWKSLIDKALQGYKSKDKHLAKDNTQLIYRETSFNPVFNKENSIEGVAVFSMDLTEEYKAQKQLEMNEKRLASIYKLSQIQFNNEAEATQFALAEAARLCNSQFAFMHEVSENEDSIRLFKWTSKPFSVSSDSNCTFEEAGIWADCIQTGHSVIHNDVFGHANHKSIQGLSIIIDNIMSVPIKFGNRITAIAGTANKDSDYNNSDISQIELYMNEAYKIIESKRTKDALEFERKQLFSIFESISELIYVSDINTKEIVYANDTSYNIFEENIIGQTCYNSVFGANSPCEFCYKYVPELEEIKQQKWQIYNPKLKKHFLLVEKLIKWPDGRDVKFHMAIDNTKQKFIENELIKSKLLLSELNLSKDKLLSIIAHDLRNPFNITINYSALLLSDYFDMNDSERISFAREIHISAQRIFKLLENLLEWARAQSNKIEFKPQLIDLSESVLNAVNLNSSYANGKNVLIESNIPKYTFAFADVNMVKTIMRNLIGNAVKYSHPDSKVIISAQTIESDFLEVSVVDSGIGISESNLEKIFSTDISLAAAGTAKEKGTGLGLILCREFVERHSGTIKVESILEKGSRFSFTLPVKNIFD